MEAPSGSSSSCSQSSIIIINLRPSPISLADLCGASQQLEPRLAVVGDLMFIVVTTIENLDGNEQKDDFYDKYYISVIMRGWWWW